jgi:hypothetical protein
MSTQAGITDRPILEAFGLYREATLDSEQEVSSAFEPDEDLSGPAAGAEPASHRALGAEAAGCVRGRRLMMRHGRVVTEPSTPWGIRRPQQVVVGVGQVVALDGADPARQEVALVVSTVGGLLGLARDLPETAPRATSGRSTTRSLAAPLTCTVVCGREVLDGVANYRRIDGKDGVADSKLDTARSPSGD